MTGGGGGGGGSTQRARRRAGAKWARMSPQQRLEYERAMPPDHDASDVATLSAFKAGRARGAGKWRIIVQTREGRRQPVIRSRPADVKKWLLNDCRFALRLSGSQIYSTRGAIIA